MRSGLEIERTRLSLMSEDIDSLIHAIPVTLVCVYSVQTRNAVLACVTCTVYLTLLHHCTVHLTLLHYCTSLT